MQNNGCSSDGSICQNLPLFCLALALPSSEDDFRVLGIECSSQCIDFASRCSAVKSPSAYWLDLPNLEVNFTLQIVDGLTPVVFVS